MTPNEFKEWRLSFNWSQEDAANALDISRGTVINYESGRRRESNRQPVEIPRTVEYACYFLTIIKHKSRETDEEFLARLARPNPQGELPTEGEADRFHHLQSQEFVDGVYAKLMKET
ncbi:MAG: helix-turn-helix domain-containing protein [Proteobacteria bacterium]|jgi:DNA-binding XRE family transcriptional regulator|nr:helix-turn-helix domain-containing protein [Pseudomonadota bacterium]